MKNINWLNSLGKKAEKEFLACCAAKKWASSMAEQIPFKDLKQLFRIAEEKWFTLANEDKMEAFQAHPQIGNISTLKKKFAITKEKQHSLEQFSRWSGEEQAQVIDVKEEVLQELAECNKKYFQKFGFIFIICATSQTAENMLKSLKIRIKNSLEKELKNASLEQNKITIIRIQKLLS